MTRERSVSIEDDSSLVLPAASSTLSGFDRDDDSHLRVGNTLQFKLKPQEISDRPYIQATLWEVLGFFRVYTRLDAKTQIMPVVEKSINWFFWFHILNMIFKGIPHVFVQVFLAAYAPQEHFYVDKMNPLTYGYNFVTIFAAFSELLLMANGSVFLLDSFIEGLTKSTPFNTCSDVTTTISIKKKLYNVKCFTSDEFSQTVRTAVSQNQSLYFFEKVYYFKYPNGTIEYFQIAELIRYSNRIGVYFKRFSGPFGFYTIFIWFLAALHYNEIFKKTVWKILNISHMIDFFINVMVLIYIYIFSDVLFGDLPQSIIRFKTVKKKISIVADIDFISESFSAPPLAHILFSRSSVQPSKIQYNYFSALLVASNSIFKFIMELTGMLITRYCEATVGVKIAYAYENLNSFHYFYPLFFSHFFIGNIAMVSLLFTKFVVAMYTFIITFHCLVECISCEWRYTTKPMVIALCTIGGIAAFLFLRFKYMVGFFIFIRIVVILVEIFSIYLMYPLGRLIEDIVFHSGKIPNALRIWNLRLVPFYVAFKAYSLLSQVPRISLIAKSEWIWTIPITLLVLGVIYAIVNIVFIEKRRWVSIFCPAPEWGPVDDTMRYCRKLFKNSEYIGSQANRTLSRYMISQAEAEVYKLDIRYESGVRRRSSTPSVKYEDENHKKFL